MNLLQGLILGMVEGLTEFLPISSTAHMVMASKLLGLDQTDYIKSFEIIIQLGAIVAVIFLYWRSLLRWEVLKRLVVAFIPTGVLGLLFYKIIKQFLLGNFTVMLSALFLGGLFLVIFEKKYKADKSEPTDLAKIPYKTCLYLGLFQSIAMIPGVSRSAATIVGGLLMGLQRKTIVEFSFLLAIPTMLAATLLDLMKNASSFSSDQVSLLGIGFASAFVVAYLSIKFFLSIIGKKTFINFGIYRMVAAAAFFLLMMNGL